MTPSDLPTQLTDAEFRRHYRQFPAQILILDRDLRIVEANDQYLEKTGKRLDDIVGRFVFDAFPAEPDVRGPAETAFRKALEGEETSLPEIYFPVEDSEEGVMRDEWWTATQKPLRDAAGVVTHVVQVSEQITQRVRAEKMNMAVLDELEHRIGNLMSLVVTIAKRIGRREQDMDSFIASFEARMSALAGTQKLLTGDNWKTVTLRSLIERHLAPYRSADGSREIVLSGPVLVLDAREAQAIAMALHELTTNAAKYGALWTSGARLEVTWSGKLGEDFSLTWRETGLTIPETPTRSGFGSEILTMILPAQLSLTADTVFDATSFTYTVSSKAPG